MSVLSLGGFHFKTILDLGRITTILSMTVSVNIYVSTRWWNCISIEVFVVDMQGNSCNLIVQDF